MTRRAMCLFWASQHVLLVVWHCISLSWYMGMNHILDNGRSIRLGSYMCTINRPPSHLAPNNNEYTALNAKYNFAVYIWDLCFVPNWSMYYPSLSDSPLFMLSLTKKLETIIYNSCSSLKHFNKCLSFRVRLILPKLQILYIQLILSSFIFSV